MSKKGAKSRKTPDPREIHGFLGEAVSAGDAFQFDHKEGALLTVVAPIRVDSGEVLFIPAPQPVAFYLVEARTLTIKGRRLRKTMMTHARKDQDGSLMVTDPKTALDCVAALAGAVLYSYTALEACVNGVIESLPDETVFPWVNSKGEATELDKVAIVRRLSTTVKLEHVLPALTNMKSFKGTADWEKFVYLRRLRDSLVHIKRHHAHANPDDPSQFGLLIRDDALACVADVLSIIERVGTNLLSDATRRALSE